MTEVSVIDVGMGNIGSVVNMLRRIGCRASTAQTPCQLSRASPVVLPGVGSFDEGRRRLDAHGWTDYLTSAEVPVLGICLGFQLLGLRSQEGQARGLGLLEIEFRRFSSLSVKVPHMGWGSVEVLGPQGRLFSSLPTRSRFYFTHSYYGVLNGQEDVAAVALYGGPFVAAARRARVTGVQFHPEKSHRFGMGFLRNWVASCQISA